MRQAVSYLASCSLAILLVACAINPATTTATAPAAPDAITQQADETAVRDVIKRLFDGMRTRDTTMMRSVFHEEARMYGVGQNGAIRVTMPGQWISGVAGAAADLVLDEVLHDVEVRIDGNLATVWAYYDLFVSADRFSHCGYDAAQLLKSSNGWKIVAIADSRRQTNCRQKRS